MNHLEFAKRELELLKSSESGEAQEWVTNNVLELLEVLGKQGHSGLSHEYVLYMFNRLAEGKPVSPLTGEEDEWKDVSETAKDQMEQNIRCSSVLRFNKDNSTAFDVSARVCTDDHGESTYTGGDCGVKEVTFPYNPPEEPELVDKSYGGSVTYSTVTEYQSRIEELESNSRFEF